MTLKINIEIKIDGEPSNSPELSINGNPVTITPAAKDPVVTKRPESERPVIKDPAEVSPSVPESKTETKPTKPSRYDLSDECPGIQATPLRFIAYNTSFKGTLIRARSLYERYVRSESKKRKANVLSWKEWLTENYRESVSDLRPREFPEED